MSLTNFPQGVSSFGMPVLGTGDMLTTGNVFFVDSGAANAADGNNGANPDKPMATIDAAIARCTANNGDIIIVMPGHDENPTGSITMDVAGVWIRGLGWGATRPTVTFGSTGSSVAMSAASTRITNIVFDLGTVATTVTTCFTVTAADCIIENCEIVPHPTSQFTNFIQIQDVDRATVTGCRLRALGAASSTSGILLDNSDDTVIVGNEISGFFTEHVIDGSTLASAEICNRITIAHNLVMNYSTTTTDLVFDLHDDTTGIVAYNGCASSATDGFAVGFDPGATSVIQNYFWDLVDQSAGLMPSASAT